MKLQAFSMLQSTTLWILLLKAEERHPWEPNYCNHTALQEENQLKKTALGQFLGYACDSTFFQCRWSVDGWKTYKKTCRKGLIYDTSGTQNCNYDFNVVGCGMKQCSQCVDDQFACCLSEECVDIAQRCDGKYDCTLEEDEQNCPTCHPNQFPCVVSEQCIPLEKRCNGIKECKDGTDEHHCDDCKADHFYCRSSKTCIAAELRCDGQRDCAQGEDETFCDYDKVKDYVCENQEEKVSMKKVCDGIADCRDGSDELYCTQDYELDHSGSAMHGSASFAVAGAHHNNEFEDIDGQLESSSRHSNQLVLEKTVRHPKPQPLPSTVAATSPASESEHEEYADEAEYYTTAEQEQLTHAPTTEAPTTPRTRATARTWPTSATAKTTLKPPSILIQITSKANNNNKISTPRTHNSARVSVITFRTVRTTTTTAPPSENNEYFYEDYEDSPTNTEKS